MSEYEEVYINRRERELLHHIRDMNSRKQPAMVTVQSRNGKKSFGFPVDDSPPGDEINV